MGTMLPESTIKVFVYPITNGKIRQNKRNTNNAKIIFI
jgi:hypothetical protein